MSTLAPDRIFSSGPIRFAGIDRPYLFEEIPNIPKQWVEFERFLGVVPGQVGQVAYGVVHESTDTGFRYASAVEVNSEIALESPLVEVLIPAHTYVEFTHTGHISTLSKTIQRIWKEWLPTSGYRPAGMGVMLECYGESFDAEASTNEVQLRFALEIQP